MQKKTSSDLTREDSEEMVEPSGSYEDMLRLTVRRLRKALTSESTSSRDLPALSRQLLAASRGLEAYEDNQEPLMEMGDDDDEEFSAEAI